MRNLIRNMLTTTITASVIAGCDAVDTMQEGFNHSQAVASRLEKSVGVKPFVGFQWHNGSLTSVTVQFERIPAEKTLAELSSLTSKAVAAEFKQEPENLVLSFVVEKTPVAEAPKN